MRYFISVGEASGDLHASNLMKAIRRYDSAADFAFMGGDKMAEVAGCAPLIHYRKMAFMGILPVLTHIGTIHRSRRTLQEAMRVFNPDLVIAVDYPSFNLSFVLPFAKNVLQTSTAYYILPKVWAWKKYRIPKIKRCTDLSLAVLPFEPEFFSENGMEVNYVGNPCADAVTDFQRSPLRDASAKDNNLVVLLPGSRRQELKENLPTMLSAVADLPCGRAVVAGAPGLTPDDYAPFMQNSRAELSFDRTYDLLSVARAALVTSGTATLEAALLGCPQVVCYNFFGGKLANIVFDRLFSVRYFSLVNLILGYSAVPELLSADFCRENIVEHLEPLLFDSPERRAQIQAYDRLRDRIGNLRCSDRAAESVVTLARGRSRNL